MHRAEFAYDLPPERIAQHPLKSRSASRLLELPMQQDRQMTDFPSLLQPNDLLIFNDTRVIPARLHGVKETGGKVEVLLERLRDERCMLAQIRASKPPQTGSRLLLAEGRVHLRVEGREAGFYRLTTESSDNILSELKTYGQMPLPPYIGREANANDAARYQTVFGRQEGAVAAPTAGLHFDEDLLAACRARGVSVGYVTLHVGAGTFQPMRVEDTSQHVMHAERLQVSETLCEQVAACRSRGGRVVGVGTTVVRALESAAQGGTLQPYAGETRLFITPGYSFRVVDALLTNFHLPESTLLMLVCAFGGYDAVMRAYRAAVDREYRFFSYGDAMWVTRANPVPHPTNSSSVTTTHG